MGDKMIFANRYPQIEPLLAQCVGLRKEKTSGAALATAQVNPDESDARALHLLDVIRNGSPLSREEAQEVVWLIDFLAVAGPDNDERQWRAETLKLASALRQDYAKAFASKAYDK